MRAVVVAALVASAWLAVPAAAGSVSPAISPSPAPGTPSLVPHKGPQTAVIRQLRECGGVMYAAGLFSTIRSQGKSYTRHGAFSFSARPPYEMYAWNPDIAGKVNSIAVADGCSRAWLGTGHGITEVSTSTGRRIAGFHAGIRGIVETLTLAGGHLLAGGRFPGSFYSLNPATGQRDGFLAGLDIHGSEPPGHYGTEVYNAQLSPNGKRLLAEGDFTSVAGHARSQIFMLNLDAPRARLTPWYSAAFNGQCIRHESFYVRSAAWSPDGSTIYVADTGDHALDWNGRPPQTGLCDLVAAFPDKWENVDATWRNFFGCDSAYSVGVAGGMVFAGGHFRWVQNRYGCNNPGRNAIPDPGVAAFTPSGAPVLTGGRARYTASRANWDNMLTTGEGLWLAGTNRWDSSQCDGKGGHSGLCFLPGAGSREGQ